MRGALCAHRRRAGAKKASPCTTTWAGSSCGLQRDSKKNYWELWKRQIVELFYYEKRWKEIVNRKINKRFIKKNGTEEWLWSFFGFLQEGFIILRKFIYRSISTLIFYLWPRRDHMKKFLRYNFPWSFLVHDFFSQFLLNFFSVYLKKPKKAIISAKHGCEEKPLKSGKIELDCSKRGFSDFPEVTRSEATNVERL